MGKRREAARLKRWVKRHPEAAALYPNKAELKAVLAAHKEQAQLVALRDMEAQVITRLTEKYGSYEGSENDQPEG